MTLFFSTKADTPECPIVSIYNGDITIIPQTNCTITNNIINRNQVSGVWGKVPGKWFGLIHINCKNCVIIQSSPIQGCLDCALCVENELIPKCSSKTILTGGGISFGLFLALLLYIVHKILLKINCYKTIPSRLIAYMRNKNRRRQLQVSTHDELIRLKLLEDLKKELTPTP